MALSKGALVAKVHSVTKDRGKGFPATRPYCVFGLGIQSPSPDGVTKERISQFRDARLPFDTQVLPNVRYLRDHQVERRLQELVRTGSASSKTPNGRTQALFAEGK